MKPSLLTLVFITGILIAGCTSAQSAALSGALETPPAALASPSRALTQPVSTATSAPQNSTTPVTPATVSPATTNTKPVKPVASKAPTRSSAIPSLTPFQNSTAAPTLGPDGWKELPVIPTIDDEVLKIYARGLDLGNNLQAFSKIGDCGSTPAWFLGDFDRGPRYFRLGEYEYLQDVIQYFQGSFDRTSLAARSGFNASALFVPLWADRKFCEANETPLACEYRVHRPIAAFIMLGTNDVWRPAEFEPQMRKIIEFSIENGVIPILVTKADNQEGDGSINATIARLALEYKVPLWNFWKAVSGLPEEGLQEDGVHLTWAANHFDDPLAMNSAWPVRNLTALQVLNQLWQKVSQSK
jgi:hypothetical protein